MALRISNNFKETPIENSEGFELSGNNENYNLDDIEKNKNRLDVDSPLTVQVSDDEDNLDSENNIGLSTKKETVTTTSLDYKKYLFNEAACDQTPVLKRCTEVLNSPDLSYKKIFIKYEEGTPDPGVSNADNAMNRLFEIESELNLIKENQENQKTTLKDRVNKQINYGSRLKKHEKYLYSMVYYDLNDDWFNEFYVSRSNYFIPGAACSSLRHNEFYGRSLDWFFTDQSDIIVKTVRTPKRYASIGVSSVANLFDEILDNANQNSYDEKTASLYEDLIRQIPFGIQDGVNEHGVFCNINVVPFQKSATPETVPLVETKARIGSLVVPRYVLDHYKTAKEAVEDLRDHVAIVGLKSVREDPNTPEDFHYMIGDLNETYIVEFISDGLNIIKCENNIKPIMTNFYITGTQFNENDSPVYTPATQDSTHNAITTNKIESHGMGLERYNLINESLNNIENMDDSPLEDITNF